MSARKPKVAVYKFSSCDGCQLSLLNMEDELLDLVDVVNLAYFLEARRYTECGPYDIALVEGAITTPHELQRIQEIRKEAQYLIALGTCATAGGIQALRNFTDVNDLARSVYAHPEYLDVLETSRPISEAVLVDLELWGCPVNKTQVLEVITALLHGRRPSLPQYAVCMECKRRATICVLVAGGIPCLGPITRAGCGALCPSNQRGCYGCFGPIPNAATTWPAFLPTLRSLERSKGETVRLLRHISNNAPAFRAAADEILAQEAKK